MTESLRITALKHRTMLITIRTQEIREEEAKMEWDGNLLEVLYALRLAAIEEALQLGATPEQLMKITQN